MSEQDDVKEALKWAEDVCSNACSKTSALGYGRTLARAYRSMVADRDSWKAAAAGKTVSCVCQEKANG